MKKIYKNDGLRREDYVLGFNTALEGILKIVELMKFKHDCGEENCWRKDYDRTLDAVITNIKRIK